MIGIYRFHEVGRTTYIAVHFDDIRGIAERNLRSITTSSDGTCAERFLKSVPGSHVLAGMYTSDDLDIDHLCTVEVDRDSVLIYYEDCTGSACMSLEQFIATEYGGDE